MISSPTIIIGAGPAGLAAAIASGEGSLLLERNTFAGKKLLLSGSGQCNFTNSLDKDSFLKACGKAANFLKPALYAFDNDAFIDLLDQADCPAVIRPDGKVFPASLHSSDVRDALLRQALAAKAKVIYGVQIVKAEKRDGFVLSSESGESFSCRNLILSGGGCSYPQTGSDGSLYQLAKSLGHTIIPPRPALASVTIKGFKYFIDCAGISLKQVQAVFLAGGKKLSAQGDLLWTHTGLSGPLILDHSHLLSSGDVIRLTLIPRAEDRVPEILKLHPRQSLLQSLKKFALPENLLRAMLTSQNIDPAQKCSELRKETRHQVIQLLSGLSYTVQEVESLQTAMATSGGVPLSEVKAHSLASALCPGLWYAGEILDYNLPTGGFNIQMAVSTGWLAGASARLCTLT